MYFIECDGSYHTRVYFSDHVRASSIRLKKIVFSKDCDVPEGFEIHTNNYIEQETLCVVLIEEDQIDEDGYEFDLWEEKVDVTSKTYFKLSLDFNENELVRDAKELINQQYFKYKIYYEVFS